MRNGYNWDSSLIMAISMRKMWNRLSGRKAIPITATATGVETQKIKRNMNLLYPNWKQELVLLILCPDFRHS